ncbi:MAG: copper chaperone PCu(A)C [Aestuariivirga sp.]|uniref:copper chaperone PCu(A)C n=1 Tax=Aestuariivirga sp. TaxID=2650926 RepID=UPI0025C4EA24|nr:copper chaperone PCu(A)C [Aestuariivirga sp.]MCA3561759.1 copper chaperone PCu(A)C [Aestuariivirga sp.]
MRKPLIEVAAAIALTLLAFLAPAPGAHASSVMVMQAYARASPTPTAEAGAAYVSLMLHGDADRLIAVSTPAAKMAGLHKTVEADGVMKMEHVDGIDIPADGVLEMKPGGYHIMLMGLTRPLKEGDEIGLTLTFEKAGEVKVKAKVGGVAQMN